MKAQKFLTALFGDVDDTSDQDSTPFVVLWRKDTKQAKRYPATTAGIKNAASAATKLGTTTDVYVGCGIQPRDEGKPGERGRANEVSVIPGCWADLDVGDHKNGRKYLPTMTDAMSFLNGLPIKPTIVVETGGGVHAWWLFQEPLTISTDEERVAAGQVVGRWQMFLRRQLGQYDMDSTFDLARVLRIPGTGNHKTDPPKQVVALVTDGPRTDPSELMEFAPDDVGMVAISDSMTGAADGCTVDVVIRAGAQPPAEKLVVFLENVEKAKDTWKRNRSDFPSGDFTPSTYCLSLATLAASVNWTDQEICDLLIAWRAMHCPESMKLNRLDWYAKTIKNARKATGKTSDRAEALGTVEAAAHGDDEVPEADVLRSVSKLLGFKVLGLIVLSILDKSGYAEEPSFIIDIQPPGKPPVKVVLPDPDFILEQSKFRKFAFKHAGVVVARVKGPEWDEIAQALRRVATEIEDVPEAGGLEGVRSMLQRYLQEATISPELSDAVQSDSCFKAEDGSIQFPWNGFAAWASSSRLVKMTAAELSRSLRAIGCERIGYDRRGAAYQNGRLKATFWRMPLDEGAADED